MMQAALQASTTVEDRLLQYIRFLFVKNPFEWGSRAWMSDVGYQVRRIEITARQIRGAGIHDYPSEFPVYKCLEDLVYARQRMENHCAAGRKDAGSQSAGVISAYDIQEIADIAFGMEVFTGYSDAPEGCNA